MNRITPTSTDTIACTRRAFLQKGLVLVSTAATVPSFLNEAAFGLWNPFDQPLTTSQPGKPDNHILVVVQLSGGNDGLNTVVPYGMDQYYRSRPGIAIRPNDTLKLGNDTADLGFHPNLAGLKELHDSGLLATIQGVGYPNPNRSHFTSMDIWHTGDPTNPNTTGWIGRYFDNTCNGSPDPDAGISIGRESPHALSGDLHKPVEFESPDLFKWIGEDVQPALAEPYTKICEHAAQRNSAGRPTKKQAETGYASQRNFLTRTSMNAQVSSDRIRAAVRLQPLVEYPASPLANQLRTVAAMIQADLPTRVYYVTLGGFDTHAGQPGSHANLMRQLGSSLLAFSKDLKAQGNDGRVLTMTFSEFGRRVGENASRGTDHGTAAPMWLMGPMVRPGVLGNHPSLTDLDQGDLKYTVDFRSIYATILQSWFKADTHQVLGRSFQPAQVLRT
ncbi:MAG: DUF1501 domain-containing protein [Planctomycetes bacterium]|nr:DUF1501 domain-containing protein [Planctomycetota bacterium]